MPLGGYSSNQPDRRNVVVWVLAAVALVASLCAVYFAVEAKHQAAMTKDMAVKLALSNTELGRVRREKATQRSLPEIPRSAMSTRVPMPTAAADTESSGIGSARDKSPARLDVHSDAFRTMMRRSMRASLRPIYEPVLRQLNLSSEERDRFYDLQTIVHDPVFDLDKAPSEATTPEERKQLEEQVEQNRAQALDQLRELLGNGYELYDSYRSTESERMEVQQFRQQADLHSAPMNDWQADRLQEILAQARRQYPPVNDVYSAGDYSAADRAALAQAAQILTPEQLESFRMYLQNQQDVRNAVSKMLPAAH